MINIVRYISLVALVAIATVSLTGCKSSTNPVDILYYTSSQNWSVDNDLIRFSTDDGTEDPGWQRFDAIYGNTPGKWAFYLHNRNYRCRIMSNNRDSIMLYNNMIHIDGVKNNATLGDITTDAIVAWYGGNNIRVLSKAQQVNSPTSRVIENGKFVLILSGAHFTDPVSNK